MSAYSLREITYRDAIREALAEEMERHPGMIIIGEDLRPGGGTFGVHAGLAERFDARMFESPISESSIVGVALGAAMAGGPMVAEIMYSDSMCVAMPATPADAKGLLKSALRGQDPVIFFEPKLLYATKGMVSDDPGLTLPFGRAAIARAGKDLTIVATGLMVSRALDAASKLEQAGIAAEVIDPRTVSPIDWDTIFASVEKTGRALIVNEATLAGSVASEIAATIGEHRFTSLKGAVRRLGAPIAPKPSTPGLEKLSYPQVEDIERVAREMVPRKAQKRAA